MKCRNRRENMECSCNLECPARMRLNSKHFCLKYLKRGSFYLKVGHNGKCISKETLLTSSHEKSDETFPYSHV